MILIVGLIAVCIMLGISTFLVSGKKSKEVESIKNILQEYKDTHQTEIFALQRDKSTLDILLSESNKKSVEIKQDAVTRLNEIKLELKQEREKKDNYIEEIKNYKSQISMLETSLREQNISMQDKMKILQDSETKLKVEFENVANKIFENNSKKFDDRNTQSLNSVLNPVKEQLRDFKQKVEDVYDKESTARGALQNELKTLKELNLKMTTEANNLTNALKSSTKQQGAWGEMVLESVLEKSGLREGQEYLREHHTTDEHGKAYRPDVVVKLPDNRDIIIDAKTSLIAYNDYMAATDEVAKKVHLKNHITSIKNHIKGLGIKDYEKLKGLNTLDFIFMFIPIEGALLLALDNEPSLYDEAFRQKIILVSPTTLLVALRAVENTWRYEKQAKSIEQVYDRATKLYDKAAMMIETFEKVGKNIDRASDEYKKAFGQLQGNGGLISQATMLKKVSNIQPKKEIDEKLVEVELIR